ncbi:hypothetical protein BOTBODRAFT_173036 [Botryobasidium botryosum FD-172 SS1]|uniref:FAS1 domain-containing protein n=1 Tax=Botryobasidium botryosum (strain FD-172 SS1) TaxID=930990 RepID=A0A067MLU7_BOTB1|nr:hypothetical protein BOTBODRAFT_173036 [Botryobasidium botryosum FD-172 SS1]
MKFLLRITIFSLFFGAVYSQNTTSLVVGALVNAGLFGLSIAIEFLLTTNPEIEPILQALGTGNKTLFLPMSFSKSDIPSDFSAMVRTLEYQVALGQISPSNAPVSPSHAVVPSLLSDNVLLQGGVAQWIVLTRQDDSKVHILNQGKDVFIHESQDIASLDVTINVVDSFLVPPQNLSATLAANNLTQFQAVLQKAGLLSGLSSQRGITVFAPSNAAFAAANATINTLSQAELTTILANHIVNSTVYSPSFEQLQASATGQAMHVSGTSVSAGKSSAKLLTTDIGLQNGALHIIDTVFTGKESDLSIKGRTYIKGLSLAASIAVVVVGSIVFCGLVYLCYRCFNTRRPKGHAFHKVEDGHHKPLLTGTY